MKIFILVMALMVSSVVISAADVSDPEPGLLWRGAVVVEMSDGTELDYPVTGSTRQGCNANVESKFQYLLGQWPPATTNLFKVHCASSGYVHHY